MNTNESQMDGRLRLAGIFVVIGLAVDALSLSWIHALAFLGSMFVGGLFIVLGIAIYLATLVFPTTPKLSSGSRPNAQGDL